MTSGNKAIRRNKSHGKTGTTLTLDIDDLSALARYVSAGMILLQTSHPIIPRLKAAMTRLGLPIPKGM